MKIYLNLLIFTAVLLFTACDDDEAFEHPSTPNVPSTENLHVGHEYVDLGLPSGTLWAIEDMSMPLDGQDCYFFSWGEIAPKDVYNSSTYKYCAKVDSTFTKYCFDPIYSGGLFTDSIGQLQSMDDVVQMHWHGAWFIPDTKQWSELYESCEWKREKNDDGTITFIGKSKYNDQVISFASKGAKQGSQILYLGNGAFYWSSDLHENNTCGYGISFTPTNIELKDGKRFIGHCVRAVVPGAIAKDQAVDLGLPSGVKWAKANIGASAPEKAGSLFAWGECLVKDYYDFSNYKHCKGTPISFVKYCTNNEFGTPDGKKNLEPEDDAAIQLWGEKWRLPTPEEMQELMDHCVWKMQIVNGLKGYQVTGVNGNHIFIPMSGTQWLGKMEYFNIRGFYWSSRLDSLSDQHAVGLFLNSKNFSFGKQYNRASGRTIRPVCD